MTVLCLSMTFGLASVAAVDAKTSPKGKGNSSAKVVRNAQSAFGEKKLFRGQISQGASAGEKQLLQGQYSQAEATFRSALNKNSRDLAAISGLGFALAVQFKLDGAAQQFKKALSIDSNYPIAHVGMAFVKFNSLQSSSMTIISQKSAILAQAESECQFALQQEPGMPEALLVLGLIQKEQGKLAEAKASFDKAIAGDANYAMGYVNRGLIELQQGDTATAIADFKNALRLRSNNSTAYYGLGRAYTQLGQLDLAYKALNTSISLNRNSAPAHIAMGDVYRAQGNVVAAIKEYQVAISIKAESEDAYLRLADIYQGRGDLEVAAVNLRSGLELNPTNTSLHLKLGEITLASGKCDDALKEYTTVLNQEPGNVAAVNGMTRALMIKAQKEANGAFFVSNNFESAEALIQRAIQMNPNSMELRLADAKLRAMSGQPVDLSTVGTPTNDAERLAYAEAMIAQFKFQEASQAMATVIANCQDANSTFAVADMALMTRDLDSAAQAYQKGGTFPGAETAARAKRGAYAVSQARQKAQQDLNLAKDLSRKGQLASGIDKYRSAAFQNPRLAEAHLGLAEALEKFQKKQSPALREAALQYNAYLALSPNLPEKEREKISKKAERCVEIASKIDQGKPPSALGSIFRPVGEFGKKVGEGIKEALQ